MFVNVILGNLFNAGVELSTIADIKHHYPENATICFGGIGKAQLKANVLGLLEADGVRVGLEDNFYYSGKQLAHNLDLIKRIHRIAGEFDFEIMKPETLRSAGFGNIKQLKSTHS